MALFGSGGHGFSLKALLEDPNLQNAPKLNSDLPDLKKGNRHGNYVNNANSAFLGGNLWDRQGDKSNDLDLEYMDLDEFLSENGIPINTMENDDIQTINLLASALGQSPPGSPIARPIAINPSSPESQGPISPPMREIQGARSPSSAGVYMPESPIRQDVSPLGFDCDSPTPNSPSAIERCLLDDNFPINIKLSEDSSPAWEPNKKSAEPDIDFKVTDGDLALVTIPVLRQDNRERVVYSPEPWQSQNENESQETDDEHLIQNSIPGQANFDPKRRKFSEEELKPQPIIKKSKKVFVEDDNKDDRYWARRKKNNVAAKRSRDARRVKENQIAMRANFLEQENDGLRQELQKTQRENEKLLKRLAKYESL